MGFRPGLPMTVFVAVFLPITLSLGAWQLQRASEQADALVQLRQNQERIVALPQDGLNLSDLPAGTGVGFCAAFTGQRWYLDNRTGDGKVGYDLYWPGVLCGRDIPVLVRLGWVVANADRTDVPAAPAPPSSLTLTGEIRPRPTEPMLTSAPEPMGSERWRVQSLQKVPLERYARNSTAIVQIQTPSEYVLADHWAPARLPPSRHVGYAIQWFGLALVLVVGYLYWGIRRSRERTKPNEP